MSRYKSGTALQKTDKEVWIDSLESTLATTFGDNFYHALQKLSLLDIRHLHTLIANRINKAYEDCAKRELTQEQ